MLHKYIVWWGLSAHIIWAGTVVCSPQAMFATPISFLAAFFGYSQSALAFSLITSAIGAIIALHSNSTDMRTLALLIPQQFFMLLAAGGSVVAIVNGAYADGVERSVAFVLADQIPWVLAALYYTLAILNHFRSGRLRWTQAPGSR